jgi:hypothetical protein
MCMHLYNCIWVVLLVSRLNLAFLSPKLSRGIDKVLVCLCPCGFDNPRNTLRWKLLQLASVCLRIILFGLRTANSGIDRKTTSDTCHFLGSSLVCWSSRKQSSVAQSTTEAEYVAAPPKSYGLCIPRETLEWPLREFPSCATTLVPSL